MLPRRGPAAYGAFCQSLLNTGYEDLAQKLLTDNLTCKDTVMAKEKHKHKCICSTHVLPESVVDKDFDNFIRGNCCLLIENIEPCDMTDYPYQEYLFTDDECERVHSGITRRDRCKTFFAILAKKAPKQKPLPVLLKALEKKYNFILTTAFDGKQRNALPECKFTEQGNLDIKLKIKQHFEGIQSHHEKVADTLNRLQNPICTSKPNTLPSKYLMTAFNHLSSLINQGLYERFEHLTKQMQVKFHADADMSCVLSYLLASRYLFGNNFELAKDSINAGLKLLPKTSNPKYFFVELYSAKTRMYITQKRLNKLESTLQDVKQVIESDRIGCRGRAAGWLYMNDGRNKTAQMMLLNFTSGKQSAFTTYDKLYNEAKDSFLRALTNFEQDGGKDGPFGTGFAVCRLAILLLQCGDNGSTMNILNPNQEDMTTAGKYLQSLEDSDIPISKILSLHYFLARSDYQFRRNNSVRALEYANSALAVAKELCLNEFVEQAHNRVSYLSRKSPNVMGEPPFYETDIKKLLDSSDENFLSSE